MTRRGVTLVVGCVLLAALLGLGASLPVPYVALGPGPLQNTLGTFQGAELIQVEGRTTYPTEGQLNLTTVRVTDSLLLGDALRLWLDRRSAVVPREIIFPEDQTDEEVNEENVRLMQESQMFAATAALRELDIPVTIDVVVESITRRSNANGVLRKGDVITAVDGTAVTEGEQLRSLVLKHKPGEVIELTYRRGERTATAPVRATSGDGGTAAIGVLLREVPIYPFDVKIGLRDEIGGSSAGLMFALGIIDKLTPGPLTGGEVIAGTGTIDDDGNVGPIGGIQQKLIAAKEAGASVFLTPKDNCAEARRAIPDGLRLVRVGTLHEAVTALDALRTGRGAAPSCAA